MRYLICLIIGAALAYGYINYYQDGSVRDERDTKVSSSGFANYGKETLSSLKSNGFVTLSGTTVKGLVDVNGKLEADGASIGSMDVNGSVTLTNCRVNGKARVNGFFSATKTAFFDECSVASQKVILTACTAPSIVIRDISWMPGTQVLELQGGSKVSGNVTFESGKGKIILSEESLVAGTIIGAEIEKK
jgi:cytoskeletal protein CcmA (bactofilin family)